VSILELVPGGGIPDSPTVGLVPAEAFLIRLPSGLSRRRRNLAATRCPSPSTPSSFSSALRAEEKEEGVVCRVACR
jgi:hypothetical protein